MAKYSNEVIYNIKTNLDQSGITRLNAELQQVTNKLTKMQSQGLITKRQVAESLNNINAVKTALNNSFNVQTGMLNLNNFNKQMAAAGLTMNKLGQSFGAAGAQGKAAFNNLVATTGRLDTNFKSLSTSGQKIMNTIGNTARWGVVSMGFQSIVTSLSSAVNYVEKLDDALIQIRMVSGESKENMREFAEYANKAASGLGSTTVDFANATKLFIQEGFSLNESKQQATQATILANVSEQDTATTADQITAYRNAFLKDAAGNALEGQAAIDRMSESLDKFANIANNTASNVNELMIASQRAASTASAVGASEDSFLASVATIQSVTRESAENIGNGLKSIYTRFADIKMGKDTEDGVSLGQYGDALKSAGVNILDEQGQYKGMTQIFSELQEAWKTLSDTQRVAVGEKVAGRFQYNRFAALMNNPEYYQKAFDASTSADGAMDRMQETYMESMAAKQNELKDAFESFLTEIYNGNEFADMIGNIADLVNLIHDATDSVGGLGNAFTGLGAIMLKVFSAGIGENITRITTNIQKQKQAAINTAEAEERAKSLLMINNIDTGTKDSDDFIKSQSMINQHASIMSNEQAQKANEIQQVYLETLNKVTLAEEEASVAQNALYEAFARAEPKIMEGVTSWDAFIKKVEEAGLKGEKFESIVKELGDSVYALTPTFEKASGELLELEEYLSLGVDSEKEFTNVAKEMQKTLETLSRVEIEGSDAQKMYKKALEEVNGMIIDEAVSEERLISILRETSSVTKQTAQSMRYISENTEKATSDVIKLTNAAEGYRISLGPAKQAAEGFAESLKTQSMLTGLTKVTSALMSLSFSLMSIKNLGNIWSDEQLSLSEKIGESLLDVSMIASMTFIPIMTTLIGMYDKQKTIMGKTALAKQKDALASMARTGATKAEIAAQREAIVAEATHGKVIKTLIAEKQKDIVVSLKRIALWAAEHPHIMMVAAALAAVAVAAKIANDAITASAREANAEYERQQNTTANLRESLNGLQEEYNDLSSSIDDISSKKDALRGLKQGTDEWKEAVLELNEAVIDTAEKYGLLNEIRNVNGVLSISEEAIKNKLEEQRESISNTQNALSAQRVVERDAKYNKQVADFGLANRWNNSAKNFTTNTDEAVKNAVEAFVKNGGSVYKAGTDEKIDEVQHLGLDSNALASFENLAKSVQANTKASGLNTAALTAKTENGDISFNATSEDIAAAGEKAISQYYGAMRTDAFGQKTVLTEEGWNLRNDFIANGLKTSKGDSFTGADISEMKTEDGVLKVKVKGEWVDTAYEDLQSATDGWKIQIGTELLTDEFKDAVSIFQSDNNGTISQKMDAAQQFTQASDDVKQQWAEVGINNINDFCAALQEGRISIDDFSTGLNGIKNASSFNELTPALKAAQNDDKTIVDIEETKKEFETQLDSITKSEVEKYDLDFDEVVDQAEALAKAFNLDKEAARDLAIQNQRMNKGVEELSKNWEDWSDILKKSNKYDQDYVKTTRELNKVIADLVGANEDLHLSEDFYDSAENMELLQKAAEGSEEAINELGVVVGKDLVSSMELAGQASQNWLQQFGDNDYLGVDKFEADKAIVLEGLDNLQANLDTLGVNQDVTDLLGSDDWVAALNEMAMATGMSAQEMNSMLSSIGVKANVVVEHVPTPTEVPEYTTEETVEKTGGGGDDGAPTTYKKTSHSYVSRYVPVQGYVDVAQINTDGSTGGPNVRYTGNGGVGSSNRGGGGKKGGGGGGGGSSKEPTLIKDSTQKAIDIYQEVNESLERIQSTYNKIDGITDRLYGANKIDNIRKAAYEEKKYADTLTKKLAIQDKELKTLRTQNEDINGNKTIHSFLNDSAFNADGSIRQDVYEAKYNELYNRIKSFEGKDQETYGDEYDKAKEDLKNFEDAIRAYYDALNNRDDLVQELDDSLGTLQDAAAAAADELLDMAERVRDIYEREDKMANTWDKIANGLGDQIWTTDVAAASRNADRFFNQTYRNGFTGREVKGAVANAGEDVAYWQGQIDKWENQGVKAAYENYMRVSDPINHSTAEEIAAAMQAYLNKADEVNYGDAYKNPYSEADLYEKANEASEKYADEIENASAALEEMAEAFDDFIDTLNDQMDRRLEQYEHITDELADSLDMIELLYGENSFDNQNKVLAQTVTTLQGQLTDTFKVLELQKKTLQEIEKMYGKNSQEYQDQEDKIIETESQIRSITKEIQTDVNQMYTNSVKKKVNTYITGMFGGSYDENGLLNGDDLDWYSQKWDMIKKRASKYKDEVEEAYEIQKLQNKYLDMLDGENNLLNQQKITAQMNEQLKLLREKDHLSAYDVAYANAQLEILQKTIALEDARANKSQMRLKRDTQGNYSYRYVANEDNVKAAENDLLDAQYNAYELSKNADIETQDGMLEAIGNFRDNLINVLTDMTTSAEEKKIRLQFLIDDFKQDVESSAGDLREIGENLLNDAQSMAELLTEDNAGALLDILNNTSLTTEEIMSQLNETFDTFVTERLDDFSDMEDGLKDLANGAMNYISLWAAETDNILERVGASFDNFTEKSIQPTLSATKDLLDTTYSFFNTLQNKMAETFEKSEGMKNYKASLEALRNEYQRNVEDLNQKLVDANTRIAQFEEEERRRKEEEERKKREEEERKRKEQEASSGGIGGDWESIAQDIATEIWHGIWGNDPYRRNAIASSYNDWIADRAQQIVNWRYYGFASGGYTGDWHDSGMDSQNGKLAILHQKELVLNATDTENILNAVELIRDVTSQMRGAALGSALGMNSILENINVNDKQNAIEQRVSIEATFPNASDANEIREALLSLADDAYQYTGRSY